MPAYLLTSPFRGLLSPSRKVEEYYLKICRIVSFHNLILFSPVIPLFDAIFWDTDVIK